MKTATEILKAIIEHGIPRALVAFGIGIPVYFLIEIPSQDWQTNVGLLILSLLMIVAGASVRIFEMKYGVFSGRIVLVRCHNCNEAITTDSIEVGNKPPQPIRCNHCQAINIIQ